MSKIIYIGVWKNNFCWKIISTMLKLKNFWCNYIQQTIFFMFFVMWKIWLTLKIFQNLNNIFAKINLYFQFYFLFFNLTLCWRWIFKFLHEYYDANKKIYKYQINQQKQKCSSKFVGFLRSTFQRSTFQSNKLKLLQKTFELD